MLFSCSLQRRGEADTIANLESIRVGQLGDFYKKPKCPSKYLTNVLLRKAHKELSALCDTRNVFNTVGSLEGQLNFEDLTNSNPKTWLLATSESPRYSSVLIILSFIKSNILLSKTALISK